MKRPEWTACASNLKRKVAARDDEFVIGAKLLGGGATQPCALMLPTGALGGNHHGVEIDLERRDAEPLKMGSPSGLIGEVFVRVLGQAGDHRAGKGALAHIGH